MTQTQWNGISGLYAYARGPFAFETVIWGVFSCLIACLALLWIQASSLHPKRRAIMIMTCMAMYGMATAHWCLTLSRLESFANMFQPTKRVTLIRRI
ncbi:hypothetical protein BDY19DRAFT_921677, partial [Irpex rosettiformis]